MMTSRIVVCTHKAYDMLPDDALYLPLQVGAALHPPIIRTSSVRYRDERVTAAYLCGDDRGENISEKNDTYSELTGLYYAWKNIDSDVIGLTHYRRQFTVKSRAFIRHFGKMRALLNREELEVLLLSHDILVPAKRRYYIETLYTHYGHTLDASQLDLAREIIAERERAYLPYMDRVYHRTWGYMFNMMIMRKEDVDAYCSWLFGILGEMEARMKADGIMDKLSSFEKRLFGRVSEILFNVWLEKRRMEGARIGEVGYLPMEDEPWGKKIPAFLAAKFTGRKYKESFT